jgi:hypothetical protein
MRCLPITRRVSIGFGTTRTMVFRFPLLTHTRARVWETWDFVSQRLNLHLSVLKMD